MSSRIFDVFIKAWQVACGRRLLDTKGSWACELTSLSVVELFSFSAQLAGCRKQSVSSSEYTSGAISLPF